MTRDEYGRARLDYAQAHTAGCVSYRENRLTGALVGVYRAAETDIDIDAPYVTVCETHGCMVGSNTRRLAEQAGAHINICDWCAACQRAAAYAASTAAQRQTQAQTVTDTTKGQDTMTGQPETSQPQGWTAAETARRQAEIRRDEEREAAQRSRNAHERSCAGDTEACGCWSLEPNHVEARCIACGAPFCETCATPMPGSADACSYCGQERPVDYIACGYVHAPGDACTAPERIVIVDETMAYTYARSASQPPEAGDTEPHWQRCDVYGSREAMVCDHCGSVTYDAWYATEDTDTLCSGCVEIVDTYDAASLAPGTPGAVWQSAQTQAAYLSRLSDAAASEVL